MLIVIIRGYVVHIHSGSPAYGFLTCYMGFSLRLVLNYGMSLVVNMVRGTKYCRSGTLPEMINLNDKDVKWFTWCYSTPWFDCFYPFPASREYFGTQSFGASSSHMGGGGK